MPSKAKLFLLYVAAWGLDTSWNPQVQKQSMGLAQTRFILDQTCPFSMASRIYAWAALQTQRSDSKILKLVYALLALGLRYGNQTWPQHLLRFFYLEEITWNHVAIMHPILQVDLQVPYCFLVQNWQSRKLDPLMKSTSFNHANPCYMLTISCTKLVTYRDIWRHQMIPHLWHLVTVVCVCVCESESAAATRLQIALLCSCADEACVCDEVRLLPEQSKHECGLEGGSEWWAAFHCFT